MGSLPTQSSPLEGESRPATNLKRVDFPQPLGPISETSSPGESGSVNLSNARVGTVGSSGAGKSLRTSRIRNDEPSLTVLGVMSGGSPLDCPFLPDENAV